MGNINQQQAHVFIADYIDGIVEAAKSFNYTVEFATFIWHPSPRLWTTFEALMAWPVA
jgi:hypothetical protein